MLSENLVENFLAKRYASQEIIKIFDAREKIVLEREFWIEILRLQIEYGLNLNEKILENYERAKLKIDLESIAKRERKLKHDVKARIEEFNSLANADFIHLGMTSRDLTENVELIQIRKALNKIKKDLESILGIFYNLINQNIEIVLVARTHNVPAQLTTLGKRFSDFAQETLLGLNHLEFEILHLPFKGLKGAVGTQSDLLQVSGNEAISKIEKSLADKYGFKQILDSTTQIYSRSIDSGWSHALVRAVAPLSSFATTFRLMAGFGLINEITTGEQVGSSAMPHKNNPRTAERINGLMIVAEGFESMLKNLSGRQWNEGDVSCSVVRRIAVPNIFYAIDGLIRNCAGLMINSQPNFENIKDEVESCLPKILSSKIMIELTKKGMGREQSHKLIKELMSNNNFLNMADLKLELQNNKELNFRKEEIELLDKNLLALTGNAVRQSNLILNNLKKYRNYEPSNLQLSDN